jgi:hypothetical protein
MESVVVGVGGPGDQAIPIDHQAASVPGAARRAGRAALCPGLAAPAAEREGEQQREQSGSRRSHRLNVDNPTARKVSATEPSHEDRAIVKDSAG